MLHTILLQLSKLQRRIVESSDEVIANRLSGVKSQTYTGAEWPRSVADLFSLLLDRLGVFCITPEGVPSG